MIKRIFIAVLVSVSMLMFSGINEVKADCEHTFQIVTIGETRYLYEYSCDGTLVGITELGE